MSADVAPAPGAPAAPPSEPRDRPAVRRVLALLIAASWIAWAVPAWQSSLHEVRPHEFIADIEAGRIVGYQAVENVRDEPWRFWLAVGSWDADRPAADAMGRPEDAYVHSLIYTVDGGRTRWASEPPPSLPDGPEIFGALQASGAQPFTAATHPDNPDWPAYPALLMSVLFLGSLVGRSTRWGTKPFWVFIATLTAGVGVVAYAVRELATDPPRSLEGPRLQWGHGLAIAVLGGLLLRLVL